MASKLWKTQNEGKEFFKQMFHQIMGIPDSLRLEYSTWIRSIFSNTIHFFHTNFHITWKQLNGLIMIRFFRLHSSLDYDEVKKEFFLHFVCNSHSLPSLFYETFFSILHFTPHENILQSYNTSFCKTGWLSSFIKSSQQCTH